MEGDHGTYRVLIHLYDLSVRGRVEMEIRERKMKEEMLEYAYLK